MPADRPRPADEFEYGGDFVMNAGSSRTAVLAFQRRQLVVHGVGRHEADKRFVLLIIGIGCGTGIILGTLGIMSGAITSVFAAGRKWI